MYKEGFAWFDTPPHIEPTSGKILIIVPRLILSKTCPIKNNMPDRIKTNGREHIR